MNNHDHELRLWTGEAHEFAVGGHGSNVAATITGARGNDYSTVGIGYQSARLLMLDYQTPTLFHGLAALSSAISEDARIINISWITPPPLPGISVSEGDIFDVFFADLNDISLVIASAGNQSKKPEHIEIDSLSMQRINRSYAWVDWMPKAPS